MNALNKTALAVLGFVAMFAQVGCSSPRTANVSIFNSSTTELRVNAWVAGQVDPNEENGQWAETARIIPPAGDTTFALNRPDPTSEPGIVVRIVPVGFDENQPYWIQLEPPGPYFLRVRGSGGDLVMSRENINIDEHDRSASGAPPSPAERRYRGSLPPWVAR